MYNFFVTTIVKHVCKKESMFLGFGAKLINTLRHQINHLNA